MRGIPPSFHVAQLRDTVNIQAATSSQDGAGQPIRTWSNAFVNQPAKWQPVAGQESVRGRIVEAGISTIFVVRNQSGITPEMRVVHSSGTYGIGYVKPVDGFPRYIELHCKSRVA
jgi:SPP1 family predicted phage head-tail adaptor